MVCAGILEVSGIVVTWDPLLNGQLANLKFPESDAKTTIAAHNIRSKVKRNRQDIITDTSNIALKINLEDKTARLNRSEDSYDMSVSSGFRQKRISSKKKAINHKSLELGHRSLAP
eukprot:Protomagalhaensia_wolfi_Nauph_80__996@NODE_1575_length_1459_cov_105_814085_g1220_i0_p3_GENE_NODE_1575_length_1459_cov_105_814085_g1220_i0NODE_1575_length_1459_cov_105_814085_g1220_i0_p3_ORF_typecomplete_len116_score5_37_NODE_1575_length_1459_cov_105_814085_g1220_i0271618